MSKGRFPWWGTVDAALKGHRSVDIAIARLRNDYPNIDITSYCRMVYIARTNTQEGAAALFGINRRTANDINFRLHCYIAEEMGFFVAKNR